MKYEDGFESVRQTLGLPTKLYNTSISGNHIEMCSYSSAMIETINITNESGVIIGTLLFASLDENISITEVYNCQREVEKAFKQKNPVRIFIRAGK